MFDDHFHILLDATTHAHYKTQLTSPPTATPIKHVFTRKKMSASEAEVEELVLPGLVGKREEQPGKDKADKVTGQRLKEINLGDDSDEDLDAEDDEDVSDR
jgi:hypothetical protein